MSESSTIRMIPVFIAILFIIITITLRILTPSEYLEVTISNITPSSNIMVVDINFENAKEHPHIEHVINKTKCIGIINRNGDIYIWTAHNNQIFYKKFTFNKYYIKEISSVTKIGNNIIIVAGATRVDQILNLMYIYFLLNIIMYVILFALRKHLRKWIPDFENFTFMYFVVTMTTIVIIPLIAIV